MNEIPEWTLGDRLAKARRRARLTQDEMAAACLVSRQTVNTWENDGHVPARRKIVAWALRTGVDPVWIESGHPNTGAPGDRNTGWFRRHSAKQGRRRVTGHPHNHPGLAQVHPFGRAA
jgi:transcriptional regulator with XRE-family HTH domain